jgi:hypothetical protein
MKTVSKRRRSWQIMPMVRFGPGLLPPLLAGFAVLAGSAAFAQAPDGGREQLALCADDGEDAFAALAAELRSSSRFAELSSAPRCADAPSARFHGRFETDGDGLVNLALTSTAAPGEERSSRAPWLSSPENPIAATIRADKLSALALLIDGLVLDLRSLSLPALPVAPPAEPIACPKVEPAPAPRPEPAREAPRARIGWGLEVGAGAVYLSPDAVAPRVELGGSIGSGRWRAVIDVHAELDSNYAIGAREFETFSSGVRLGARHLFFRGERSRIGVELAAAWVENRYRRADLAGAHVRKWADFGLFVGAFGRVRIAGPLGAFLRIGVAIFPTARVTAIAGGPEKQVNLITVPGVAGLDLDF